MADEFKLSDVEVNYIITAFKNLKEQADFYGMDIDLETASLVTKRPAPKPTWLTRWLDKVNDGDNHYDSLEREERA